MLKQSLHLVPLRADLYKAKVVFWAFIASLSMFFLAGVASYIIIRKQAFIPIQRTYEPLVVPIAFWVSTAFLLLTSFFLERSIWFVRREHPKPFLRNLFYAAVASLVFVVVQGNGLSDMFVHHFSSQDGSTKIYGLGFALASLHALHVLGGMVFLWFIIHRALGHKYDHERHWAVNHCAGYWHFLDVVWIVMLGMFLWTN